MRGVGEMLRNQFDYWLRCFACSSVRKHVQAKGFYLCGPGFKYMNGETLTLEGGMGQRP